MGAPSKKTVLLFGLLIGLTGFFIYLPALRYDFVNWDDSFYVYDNPHIKTMNYDFFVWVFTKPYFSNWHPLTLISLAIDHIFWGLNPAGYHLTNVILHALNTFLVFTLTHRLVTKAQSKTGGSSPGSDYAGIVVSSVTAVLFGLHPLHVESVAWVSERKDILYSFFFLLSLIFYVRYASFSEGRITNYLVSVTFFAFSVMSKPMAVTMPVVLLILDFYPLERMTIRTLKSIIIEKLPWFFISLSAALLTIRAQKGAVAALEAIETKYRVFLAFRNYSFYLQKMFFPADLLPFYPHPVSFRILSFEYLGSALLFFVISFACVLAIRKYKVLFASWAYYVITILPVTGLFQAGSQAYADRYAYLPSLGIFLLLGVGLSSIWRKFSNAKIPVIGVIAVLIVLLGVLTSRQMRIWKDSITLWDYEINFLEMTGDNDQPAIINNRYKVVSMKVLPYYNRAEAHLRAGNFTKAIDDYNKIIGFNKYELDALMNRSRALMKLGRYERAIDDLNEAVKIAPENPDIYQNRAMLYAVLGEKENALRDFSIAERLRSRKR